MARITPRQRQWYGPLLTGAVPASVLKQIGTEELEDRLAQASGLMQQAAKAATPGAGRQFGEQAQRILGARPRAETEQIVAGQVRKAKLLGNSPQAADLERQAREELLAHPPAVRRAVAKADAEDEPVPVFDADGNLIGICDPDDITPVTPVTTGQRDGGAADAQVAKAAGRMVVYDQWRRPHLADRRAIRQTARPQVAKADGSLIDIYDKQGRPLGRVRPGDVEPADVQARNRGPVTAGGTTGLGQPRRTGPPASLPADGPQAARPGDVSGRQVVKAGRPGRR